MAMEVSQVTKLWRRVISRDLKAAPALASCPCHLAPSRKSQDFQDITIPITVRISRWETIPTDITGGNCGRINTALHHNFLRSVQPDIVNKQRSGAPGSRTRFAAQADRDLVHVSQVNSLIGKGL